MSYHEDWHYITHIQQIINFKAIMLEEFASVLQSH